MFRLYERVLTEQALVELESLVGAASAQIASLSSSTPLGTKDCLTVPYNTREGARVAEIVDRCLEEHRRFPSGEFPVASTTPRLVVYRDGMYYGPHIDSPRMTSANIRNDLAMTIFVSGAESYRGGALRVRLGDLSVDHRGQAGSAIVYPAQFTHEVTPVQGGDRIVVLLWFQSALASWEHREVLYELSVAQLEDLGEGAASIETAKASLFRMWLSD